MVVNSTAPYLVAIDEAVNVTANQLLAKLMDIIEETVYSYDSTWTNGYNGDAGRTGQFKQSWEASRAVITGNIIESKIFQNYVKMSYIEPFSHGSAYYNGALDENGLNRIIEEGIPNTGIGFPEVMRRPFWENFKQYVDENLEILFMQNCRAFGLDLKSGVISATF